MKSVLILVLSHDKPPYNTMVDTAIETWDYVEVPGTQTIYYFDGKKQSVDEFLYVDVPGGLLNMGRKTLAAFEHVLNNHTFDYIARIHSSIYCNKQALIEYVQTLPDTNIFAGSVAESANKFQYVWGGTGFILSRDVVTRIVANKHQWQHKYMEDESMSLLVNWLSIPFSAGYAGAIDNMGDHYRCISYGGESITFLSFGDIKRLKHHFIRVKCDKDREQDAVIMRELFKVL